MTSDIAAFTIAPSEGPARIVRTIGITMKPKMPPTKSDREEQLELAAVETAEDEDRQEHDDGQRQAADEIERVAPEELVAVLRLDALAELAR